MVVHNGTGFSCVYVDLALHMCLIYMYVRPYDCIASFLIKMQVFLTKCIELLGTIASGSKARLTGDADNIQRSWFH